MPSRRGLPLAVLLLLSGVLLAGCAEPVRGTAVAKEADVARYQAEKRRLAEEAEKRKADEAELTSAEALGDLTSLDMCSLLPGNDFGAGAKVGSAKRAAFGSCSLTLTAPRTKAELRIGPVEDGDSTPTRHKPYDKQAPAMLKVVTDEPGKDYCTLYLEFPDDVRLRVQANTYLPGGTLAKNRGGFLCRASVAAIDQVIDTVTADGAEHWDLAANSFGTASTCDAIRDELIDEQVADGASNRKLDYPSGQQCQWGKPGAAPRAVFQVDAAVPARDGRAVQINGRQTYLNPSRAGDLRYCYLETAGKPFRQAGKGAREIASLYVVLNPGKRNPCTVARTLAETAWRALPD